MDILAVSKKLRTLETLELKNQFAFSKLKYSWEKVVLYAKYIRTKLYDYEIFLCAKILFTIFKSKLKSLSILIL